MNNSSFKFSLISISLILEMVLSCTTTTIPLTGRKQKTFGLGAPTNDQIIQYGADAYNTLMDSLTLSQDSEKVAMIKNVGTKIQGAVETYLRSEGQGSFVDGFDWEFNLIDNDTTVNAWAMSGGKVAFYTGILPICQDELGVAVVMGHEIAHAIARHGYERVNQNYTKQIGFTIGAVALGQNPSATQQIIFQAAGLGTDIALLKYSRLHESEADEMGLYFMAMAGYDPSVAPSFWERMSGGGSNGQAPPEFMSTHPSHETRIKRLNDAMPKALEYYNAK